MEKLLEQIKETEVYRTIASDPHEYIGVPLVYFSWGIVGLVFAMLVYAR
jgi:hypothetical protein